MEITEGTIRSRRSDYIIRKQADYGPRRWSIHYRKRHYSDPYVIAWTDTREQARNLVEFLMDVEKDRFQLIRMEIRSGNADRKLAAAVAKFNESYDRIMENAK
jgi:hypothetical protein